MPSLDVRTIFIICAFFTFIYGFGMIAFARKMSHSFDGIYLFAAINLLIATAISLSFFRDYIDIVWSIIVDNSLFLLTSNLIYYAHLQFIGQKKNLVILSTVLIISTISLLIFFTYIIPNTNSRIIVLSTFHGLQFLLTARVIWRFQQQTKQTIYTPLIVISAAFAVFFAFRLSVTVFSNDIDPYKLANNSLHALLIIFMMLYIAALDFFIVLIATERLVQKVADLADRDTLTKLYNRRGLDHEMQDKHIFEKSLAVIMCDIDHFKVVNDRFGHNVGDIVIKKFAEIIKELTRNTDICTRWGGEEFLIILPLTDEKKALIVAEKIRLACEQCTFPEQPDLLFTASFGICAKKEDYSFDDLVNNADEALYQAKTKGRNQVCIF